MKKLVLVVMALILAAGMAYAADQAKKVAEPVTTVVEDTGAVVETAAQGVVDTVNVKENKNPVKTAVNSTAKVAEAGVKTVTLQKVKKDSKGTKVNSK